MTEDLKVNPAWTADRLLALGRSYQEAAVLAAAADLDLFTPLASTPATAAELAALLECDGRGLIILLDALAGIGLVRKTGGRYALAPGLSTGNAQHFGAGSRQGDPGAGTVVV